MLAARSASTSSGSGSASLHAERRRVDDDIVAGRVVGAGAHVELRIVLAQPLAERVGRRGVARRTEPIAETPGRGERRRDGRADAARADDERARARQRLALALDTAHEPGAVEHVAEQRAVGRFRIALQAPAISRSA